MKNVTILGVVALAIVGFVYFTLFSTPAHEMKGEAQDSMEEYTGQLSEKKVVPEPRQGIGTLESLRLGGEDMECTISYSNEEQQSSVEGTYFVSGGSMRGDFLTEAPDLSGQILSSMIINDVEVLYVWSEIEGVSYGIKMNLGEAAGSEVEAHEPVALDAEVRYDCKPWENVDRTVFVPPSDILFQDMNELMRSGMEYGTVYEEPPLVPEM